jgi:2-keto-4-pentenoate hydratase/2-oxohepta-3-ene-1,7-dioic acid hydratase in catechol pathway
LKIARYSFEGHQGVGIVSGSTIVPAGTNAMAPVPEGDPIPLSALELLPPVGRDAKIVCVGLNYADHAAEGGVVIPEEPLIFAKLSSSLIGPGRPIVLPTLSNAVDFEAEVGVVIARRAHRVSVDEARDYLLGFTCVNDVSARDLQSRDGQWTRAKSLDSFCPVGPWVVTIDEIPDPQALGIRCLVNGEVMQDSSTASMIFGVDQLVSFISQGITLEPGDLISTGTPAGVGFLRDPPRYLSRGDEVRVEIDRIGYLENPVK